MSVHSPPIGAATTAPETSLLQGELRLAGRLDARFFALLRALQLTGSLHKAARTAGYSYKGAWLVLEQAALLARAPLVVSAAGGHGGGGSRLTPAAQDLLAAWGELQGRHGAFLHAQEAWLLAQPGLAALLRHVLIKATARNQFAGSVVALQPGPVATQATFGVAGGQEITASLTSAAAARLGLALGRPAIVLVKASDVVLVAAPAGWALSARNQLAGTVARVEAGEVASLVGLTLPGGAVVTACVSNDAVAELGLVVGQPATATFQAASVMVAAAA